METKDKAAFKLDQYIFEKLSINAESLMRNNKLSISFEPKGKYINQKKQFILIFSVSIFNEDGQSNNKVIEVICNARFSFENVNNINEIPNYFYTNSIAILFPYIRAMVSTLTLQANIPAVILPTMNLSSLHEELKKNTTAIND